MKARVLHEAAFRPALALPQAVSRDEAALMSPAARKGVAEVVRTWLNGLCVDSDRDRHVHTVVRELIRDNLESAVGTSDLLLLTGANALGKSTLINQLTFALHREYLYPHSDPLTRPNIKSNVFERCVHAPVVVMTLAAATTVTKFDLQLARVFDYEPTARRVPDRGAE